MIGKLQLDGTFIDVLVEVKNGVLVFTPVNDYSKFKDGDIITCGWENKTISGKWVCVLRGQIEVVAPNLYIEDYCSLDLTSGRHELLVNPGFSDSATYVRYATEEEKKQLFDALAKEGKMWDAEKKEVVDLKWKPKINEAFYFPLYELGHFVADSDIFFEHEKELLKTDTDVVRGWVFRTKQECQEFCDRLNSCILSIKP